VWKKQTDRQTNKPANTHTPLKSYPSDCDGVFSNYHSNITGMVSSVPAATSRLPKQHEVRAGRRGIRRRRHRDVIISAASLTGTGSHVTSRRPGRVDVSVVDVAVDEAEHCAGADEYQQNDQTDIHQLGRVFRLFCRSTLECSVWIRLTGGSEAAEIQPMSAADASAQRVFQPLRAYNII